MKWHDKGTVAAGALALALGGCSAVDGRGDGSVADRRPASVPGQALVADSPVKIGAPYTVGGTSYTPEDTLDYDQVGYASWYGEELLGRDTANGEPFNPDGISGAHRTLPLPSYVEVTALDTGRTILVRLNDRGPFSNDRLIDLSQGAARQLGIAGQGHAPVRVRRVNPPESERILLRQGRTAAERLETPEMMLTALRKKLGITPQSPAPIAATKPAAPVAASRPIPPAASSGNWFVQLGAFSGKDRAESMAKRAGARVDPVGSLYRVRFGPYRSEAEAKEALRSIHAKGYPEARILSGG
jgi:rare lipoprotein A